MNDRYAAIHHLRRIGLIEGISFLVLLGVAMPLKYLAGLPLFVRVTGSVHGLLFLWFVSALFRAADERRWSRRRSLAAFAWSLVPFGMLVLERTIGRELQRTGQSTCAPVRAPGS